MAENYDIMPRFMRGIYLKLASHDKNYLHNYVDPSIPSKKRFWGEVTRVETLNYRTYKPEPGGLFCEKIFGPIKDWECHCGKYKTSRYNGIICDKCGVEVTEKSVRRDRMGYVQLVVPIVHVWYCRSLSNKVGLLIGINSKNLEKIVYYERYVVIQPGASSDIGVQKLDLLSDEEYWEIKKSLPADNKDLSDEDPRKFIAKMGGEAIEMLLKKVNIDELAESLKQSSAIEKTFIKKQEILKKLKIVSAFKKSNSQGRENKPEWMVIRVLPVIPAGLRPLVQLDGGKFATSDLNELYRKVIIRNERLRRLIDSKAPDIILRNEKRMLQESVDSLMEKAQGKEREGKVELKSLSDSLKGKHGLFRQNLLGKRVDYSGRSVIVVGPDLKLHECGLPKDMALELFKPFVIRKLIERRLVETVKFAKKIIAKKLPIVWEVLESVLKGHPVLLNRAPSLHRLSIQAFQPVLIEGKAIQLHPLLCTAFNADFDGDQMAVHIPLSVEAIVEAILLLLSSQNIFSPSNGKAITLPSKDMILGIYFITKKKSNSNALKGSGMVFYSPEEVMLAYDNKKVDVHADIKARVKIKNEHGVLVEKLIDTTPGRVLFNKCVPSEIGFINELVTGKKLQQLVSDVCAVSDTSRTVEFLDDIKKLGFEEAYKSGISIGLFDVQVPEIKHKLIQNADSEVEETFCHYISGLITEYERYNKVVDIWTRVNGLITAHLMKNLEKDQDGFNPIFMMVDSGARGSREQLRQIAGIRGLMSKPQKNTSVGSVDSIIETPIISSFKEGLDAIDYFISGHGSRKGLGDTALKTADAGYLTRRVIEACQNSVVDQIDCGTVIGVIENHLIIDDEIVERISERILGRVSVNNIFNPLTGELILASGAEVTNDAAKKIDALGISNVEVRSIFTCLSKFGVCSKCYGINFATGKLSHVGDAVGVIAAQSIGEPGTQLTLRTFHVGGTAASIVVESKFCSKYDGKVTFKDLNSVKIVNENGEDVHVVTSRSCELRILDLATSSTLSTRHIAYGSYLRVSEGDIVQKDQEICYWDPYNGIILADKEGHASFEGLEEGVTYVEEFEEQSTARIKIIIESKARDKNPVLIINTPSGEALRYNLPVKARLLINEGQQISQGQVLCKIPRVIGKSRDITGGLPRVTELLEVRTGTNCAILSEIDGVVSYGVVRNGYLEVFIESRYNVKKRYLLPLSRYILVQPNDYVKAGDRLSEGSISPVDLLEIKGLIYIQKYFVNELQEVYRLQGVKINDKHMEVVIYQMMTKIEIVDPGDTRFVSGQLVDRVEFRDENFSVMYQFIILDSGDSYNYKKGQIISSRSLDEENNFLDSLSKQKMVVRQAMCAIAKPKLRGITKSSLFNNRSFLSAASFQEPVKVLCDASLNGAIDNLNGFKECVITGKLIPAGTGLYNLDNFEVCSNNN